MKWQVGDAAARWRRWWEWAAPFVNAALVIAFSAAAQIALSWDLRWAFPLVIVALAVQVQVARREMRRADEAGELVRSDVRGAFSVHRVSRDRKVRADVRRAAQTADARDVLRRSDLRGALRVSLPWPNGQARGNADDSAPSRSGEERG